MDKSQYTASYLHANAARLRAGQGAITINTYLSSLIPARYRERIAEYEHAIELDITRRGATRVSSVDGGIAYVETPASLPGIQAGKEKRIGE